MNHMTYVEVIIALLALLQIKHWYIDFVDQTMEEVHSKGIYGDYHGIMHSLKQGVGTLIALLIVFGLSDVIFCLIIAFADFVIHYHTDWAKINLNKRYNYTIENPKFWMWLGADQLVHQLTYIGILWVIIV